MSTVCKWFKVDLVGCMLKVICSSGAVNYFDKVCGVTENTVTFKGSCGCLIVPINKIVGYNADSSVAYADSLNTSVSECLATVMQAPVDPNAPVVKTYQGVTWWVDNNATGPDKLKTLICFDRWLGPEGFCYYPYDEAPAEDDSNLITIENFTKMNAPGTAFPLPPKNSTGLVSGEICGATATLDDILQNALGNPAFVMPDGSAPDGILYAKIWPEHKGAECEGIILTASKTVVTQGTVETTLQNGESLCFEKDYTDADCDGKVALNKCADLATAVVNSANGALRYAIIGVVCDPDDADETV